MNIASRTKIEAIFLGGLCGDNLTGSMTLLTIRKGKRTTRILVDAGLFQGKNSEEYNKKAIQSVDPKKIDTVIITHAHNDHVGLLVWLVKKGFHGKIIATKHTVDIFPIIAKDSAKIQEEDFKKKVRMLQRSKTKEKRKRLKPPRIQREKIKPDKLERMMKEMERIEKRIRAKTEKDNLILYDRKDVEYMLGLKLFKNGGYEYDVPIRIAKDISVKLYSSGHILGGGSVVLTVKKKEGESNLCFTSDLGRTDNIILPALEVPKERMEYLFIESTYGNREHPNREKDEERYFSEIRRCHNEGKKVTESVFALQRPQENILKKTVAMLTGKIPEMPIYIDSPLLIALNEVFAGCWDMEEIGYRRDIITFNPFKIDGKDRNPFLRYVEDKEESADLVRRNGQFMVMACSGMGTNGRIVNHYAYGLPQEDFVFFILGYAVSETTNSKLARGERIVEIGKKPVPVRARIEVFLGNSGHGDADLLCDYATRTIDKKTTKKVFVVHGSKEGGLGLKRRIIQEAGGIWESKIVIPQRGEAFQL